MGKTRRVNGLTYRAKYADMQVFVGKFYIGFSKYPVTDVTLHLEAAGGETHGTNTVGGGAGAGGFGVFASKSKRSKKDVSWLEINTPKGQYVRKVRGPEFRKAQELVTAWEMSRRQYETGYF